MIRRTRWFPTLLIVCIGCQEQSLAPTTSQRTAQPSFETHVASRCPETATFTVTDETSFQAALKAAKPGDVIAVRGVIALTSDDSIFTDDLTITCATPGSGFVATGAGVVDMLTVGARSVVVDGLVLDGTQAGDSPYTAINDGAMFFAAHARFTHNTVTCTPGGLCVFFVGGVAPVVSDNHFTANGSFSGVQLQANGTDPTGVVNEFRIDDARVERNTIVTTAPSTGPRRGAIRVFDANRIVVTDNVAVGPWRNGFSPVRIVHSRVIGNQFQGPVQNGIRTSDLGVNVAARGRVTDNVFRDNTVAGAGEAGIFAMFACSNRFVVNDLTGNAGDLGMVLDVSTGANRVVGTEGRVIDNGAFDCDGDGDLDPNVIRAGGAEHGVDPSADPLLSEPVRTVHGIVVR